VYPEDIVQGILDHFEANYETYLIDTETAHAADPITLGDFKSRIYADEGVFNESRQYPYLLVYDVETRPFVTAQQPSATIFWQTTIQVEMRFRDTDAERLAKTVDRHLEAFWRMLQADPTLGGACPRGYVASTFRTAVTRVAPPEERFRGRLFRFGVIHRM